MSPFSCLGIYLSTFFSDFSPIPPCRSDHQRGGAHSSKLFLNYTAADVDMSALLENTICRDIINVH